jgi:drug/metabolite transporter (DMT)-like permease
VAWRILVLLLGVYACSTAVIFIKASHVHPVLLSGYRLLFAGILLSPLYLRAVAAQPRPRRFDHLRRIVFPATVLALHFISWTVGARLTSSANGSLIVNLVPIAMPFFTYFLLREALNRGEVAGTIVALTGVLLLGAGDYAVNRENLYGDVICFGSMLLFAFYLALGRKNRDVPVIWLYVVPLYTLAGLMCFAVSPVATNPLQVFSTREYLILLGLAVIPTIAGHSLLNYSLKHLRGQTVSVCNLAQFLFAGVMGYLFFAEVPPALFYFASVLMVAGTILTIRSMPRE